MAVEQIRIFNPQRRTRRQNQMSSGNRNGKVAKFRQILGLQISQRQTIRRRRLRGYDGILHGINRPIEFQWS